LSSETFEVVFQPEGKRVECPRGGNLFDAAKAAHIEVASICGGQGTCGKCRIIIDEDRENAGPIAAEERSHLSELELSDGYRLACRTRILGGLTVNVPIENRTITGRFQLEGVEAPVKINPSIRKYLVQLKEPDPKDPRSDADRLLEGLASGCPTCSRVDYDVLKGLPRALRGARWSVTAIVLNDETIIGLEPGDTRDKNFGYAVDIGTTKLAGYLLDLNTGRIVAAGSMMNPQLPYGEDVLTRISYAMKGSGNLEKLQRMVASGVNQILIDLCLKANVSPEGVYEMTAVGNTPMHHMFLKLDPEYLALSPYVPVVTGSVDVKAKEVDIKMNGNGNVHLLPLIGGFVGADCVAVILATEIHSRAELCLALDIGTNTEVVLGNRDWMLACSCASGPAFEGGNIGQGMRAEPGAIERVKIDPESLDVQYWTIDSAKPRGICGSGLVDALAEMLKSGIVDAAGAMNKGLASPRLRSTENGPEFVLAWGKETRIGRDIVVTQRDVRELQLAKGAIHAGATMLMRRKEITEGDVGTVFVAGAFGSYMNPESARTIGMYPEIELERFKAVGNAAGTGARMALMSREAREKADEISRRVEYVELAAEPGFQREFLNSQYMPYADLSRYPETSELLRRLGRYPKKPIPFLR
jgi:uncharacterized 2Fe-2S/4Fe-4S cluster protein (DUF4445 family)